MKTLLLLGNHSNDRHPCDIEMGNTHLLDWQIQNLENLGHEVVVVFGGKESDLILRGSQKIQNCDIIYDTNDDEITWSTNLRSGLYGVKRHCFVLPIYIPCPPAQVWRDIETHLFRHALDRKAHIIKPHRPEKGLLQPGFPWLVTARGKNFILFNDNIDPWQDTGLIISRTPTLSKSITSLVKNQVKLFKKNETNDTFSSTAS